MNKMNQTPPLLLRRIRWLTGVFIVGLVVSGVTAIPLVAELNWLSSRTDSGRTECRDNLPAYAQWIEMIRTAAAKTQQEYPFLFYGTDWLAFGHVVIAVAFLGALRDPVRNRWLFDFGLVACAMVIPWAFVFGAVRGIPVWWRLIDCAFGVCGAVPLWWCRRWIKELESGEQQECRSAGFCCSPPAPPTEQLWQNLFWRTPRRFASACARDSCASFWTAPALWRFRLTETALSRTIPGSRQRLMMRPPAKAEV